MKKFVISICLVLCALSSSAQRLVYNEKAPELDFSSFIVGSMPEKGRAIYLDFFMYGAPQNDKEIEELKKIANSYGDKIDFVVVTKDSNDKVVEYFKSMGTVNFSVAVDNSGQTFANYGVRYLPYSVLINKKGDFVWQGKNSKFTKSVINQFYR